MASSGGVVRRRVAAYAALVRVPNLFTAPPDVLLGASLSVAAGGAVSLAPAAGLSAASASLYAAGTALNDYVDAPEDARERPERPIPSGRVSRSAALSWGLGLLALGVVLALAAAGAVAGALAAALAATVLAYDGALKGGVAGFLAMGTARGLNVLLGTALGGGPVGLPAWALAVPVVVAGYVAGFTYLAEREAAGADRGTVAVAVLGAVAAAVAAPTVALAAGASLVRVGVAAGLAAAFLAFVGRPLRAAYIDPAPERIGPAIGACVLGLVVVDAAVAATAGLGWAALVGSFLVPAVAFARLFDVS